MSLKLSGVTLGNITGGPSSLNLSDLHDVSIVSPATGQYLRYNAGISEWQNSIINYDVFTSLAVANGVSISYNGGTTLTTITLGNITPTSVASTGTVTGTNLSGTNTGDQTITLTGDITGSGTGSFATTLATVNSSPQSDTFRKITVNGKGLVTATSAVTSTDITDALGYIPTSPGGAITASQITLGTTMNLDDATLTTSSTTPNQVVSIVDGTIYRSIKYLVQAVSGTEYQMSELNIIHDGTTAYITEYGAVFTGNRVATFDADLSGSSLRLLVTPTNAVTTIKMIRTAITL